MIKSPRQGGCLRKVVEHTVRDARKTAWHYEAVFMMIAGTCSPCNTVALDQSAVIMHEKHPNQLRQFALKSLMPVYVL